MKAIYKRKEVEVWEISRSSEMPDWVFMAFKKNIFQWVDNRLRILMPALYPRWANNSEHYGYSIYTFGNIGDYVDLTNGKVVPKSYFRKHYLPIEDK
ncbi:hypothetical protein [Streptococcus ovuberis]|uniref:Role in replication n=1 Tax=Streptococcus ovuberis TaxID=1936207 RepID=A0A7X6N0T9_9STRE|nr:hypothetical protein [Streptococcus ovuberis]NKZ20137.1 hypothetical protein [Streptococcus ovuberis]